ncbi:tripartite tricarboxylate transporter substrate binding protein [Elioraea sp. Yellowstone]|jgi:tripartite-type tricarboxylate transporter receptor subunit TctC|uniref:Bug family tripartite tricarboxylate transporter substrate binding protein n=1 Tax=Elioraea sp. Yellowstone TaxID=2592070 RepID=UPI001152D15D|nr:tripartite tricarboxylate transporter substrate-binding protein [Elioraea sp. Yellowstone]TQF80122.1 tripartite tricarboxylate transporter substrate binding protein [Elioraea sp. Yellowstone]
MTPGLPRRLLVAAFAVAAAPVPASAWEPQRPITIIVPAGTGGGADQMARAIQAIVAKHGLAPQPIVVANKAGGAGAEGFLEIKNSRGNPHMLVITLSNLFTTPLATGVPFSWRDITPVKMMALDEFVLWVNAESPWRTAADFVAAARAGKLRIAGTGSRQEDQIITVAIGKAIGAEFTYVPFAGGGTVAMQLVGGHVDATVNNPIEAVSHWRAGKLRPLCVFDSRRLPVTQTMTATMAWSDIPTCKESGLDVEYLMLRGFFMPPGVPQAAIAYYQGLLERVRQTPEWQELMVQGAFNTTTMEGDAFAQWLAREEERHRTLMAEAGFLAR